MLTPADLVNPLRYVIEHSTFVSIDETAMTKFARKFSPSTSDHWLKSYPLASLPNLSLNDQIDLFFLMGSQAFCFWGQPKWIVEYKGQRLDGWWALVACFHRAIERGIPITDSGYLASLTISQTRQLFLGTPEIPLLKERHQMLQAIGQKMAADKKSGFHEYINPAHLKALELLDIIITFPGFDDTVSYKGKPIPFYKKAQMVISDLDALLSAHHQPGIAGMALLPGHADYKIPAQLRKLGILKYSPELEKLIDHHQEIPAGSEMEVEIRANHLWSLHLLVEPFKPKFPDITANTLNGMLWLQSQTKDPADKPYHLTRTIYY